MNVGSALKITCVGMGGGIIIRLIGLLFFFDYETGFYERLPFYPWISILFCVAASVCAVLWCNKDGRTNFARYTARKNAASGIISVASAVALIFVAIVQLREYINLHQAGTTGRNYAQSSAVHLLFILASFFFAGLQMLSAVMFFTGKNYYRRWPVACLISVLWGVSNLVFIFVYYAKSVMISENLYIILGNAALLLCLFYISKTVSGVGGENSARRCFQTGFFAININMAYTVSNLMAAALGNNYYSYGEIPLPIQVANLSVALFILVFLFTFRKYNVSRKPKQSHAIPNEGKYSRDTRRFRAD